MIDRKIKLAGLWERTSKNGNVYMTGRLGLGKLVLLKNLDRQADNEPTHWLFFAEASKGNGTARQQDSQPRQDTGNAPPAHRRRQARTPRQRPSAPAAEASAAEPFHDDPLPWTAGG